VRSGSHGTSVMRLDLGDATRLSAEDVRVETHASVTTVRVARDLLPPVREPEPEAVPAPQPEIVAKEADATSAETSVVLSKKPFEASKVESSKPLAQAVQPEGAGSVVSALIGITALLGLIYGAMRVLMQKRGYPAKEKAIDVVAQKRLGPRHQLVIVQAFGKKHLLSIQGGTTTPIATSEEVDDLTQSGLNRIRVADQEDDEGEAPAPPVAARQKVEEPTPQEDSVAFGGALLKAAMAQRAMEREKTQKNPVARRSAPPKEKEDRALSQAVAGLVRLRREAQL